jgi:hypothetical protein
MRRLATGLLLLFIQAHAGASETEKTCSSASDPFAGKTIKDRKMGMEMILHRNANAPKPGQLAPTFDLPAADGKSRIELASFRNKSPVVLVFGSYT